MAKTLFWMGWWGNYCFPENCFPAGMQDSSDAYCSPWIDEWFTAAKASKGYCISFSKGLTLLFSSWADFPGSISAAFCDEENCRRVCLKVSLILIFSIFINWPLECLHRRMQHIGTCFFVCRFESKDFFLKASGIFFSRKVSLVRKHH